MRLIVLSLAWLGGTYLGTVQAVPAEMGFGLALIAAGLALAGWRALWGAGAESQPQDEGWRGTAMWWGTLLLVAAGVTGLAGARYQGYHHAVVAHDPLASLRDTGTTRLRGLVDSEPQVRDVTSRWRLAVTEVHAPGAPGWQPGSGQVLVYQRWLSEVRYGDVVELTGKLQRPPELDQFDYPEYLARQGIHSIMRYPGTEIVERNRGSPFLAEVYRARAALSSALQQAIPEPEASIAVGVLLGMRTGIPREIEESFRVTGTTHVLAVSGQNLTIASGLVIVLVARFSSRRSWKFILLMLLSVWGYALLVGFVPSIVRAAGMVSLILFARAAGRQQYLEEFLLVAAALMVAWEPVVLFDLGFQLSVSAMAGLLLVPPLLERLFTLYAVRPGPAWVAAGLGYLGQASAATLGAGLVSLPIVALNFHTVPLAALPASIFAVPALPFILLSAGFTSLAGLLAPALAVVPGLATWVACKYLLVVVAAWAAAPTAASPVPEISPGWGWVYLAVVLLLLKAAAWKWPRDPEARQRPVPRFTEVVRDALRWRYAPLLAPALLCALFVWIAFSRPDPETVWVRFLDVGQGDALWIETAPGHRVLVDGGPSPSKLLTHLGSRLPPWDEAVDLLILTHAQRDHISGLLGVLERYPVGAVIEPGVHGDTGEHQQWNRLLEQRGIRRIQGVQGTRVRAGPAELEVLYPARVPERGPGWTPNDGSLVLRLTAHGTSVLLTGDIERFGEEALLRQGPRLASTVLKIPHHGSKTSTSRSLLEAVTPQAAVVSLGAGNRFGHPAPPVLERLAGIPVLRTDQDGTVELTITPNGAVLRGQRPRAP